MTSHVYITFALGLKAANFFPWCLTRHSISDELSYNVLEPSIAFCECIGILTSRHAELPLAAAAFLDLKIQYN